MTLNSWTSIYRKLAMLLFEFYKHNSANCGPLLFELCFSSPGFLDLHPWMKKFRDIDANPSLDPITIFASFSGQSGNNQKRIEKINLYFQILGGKAKIDEVDFTGCPMPRVSKVMSHRKQESQNEIWQLFSSIMENGRSGLGQTGFDQCKYWFGINIPSLTIFMFWIDSDHFIGLDNHTTSYLINQRIISHPVNQYDEYDKLLEATKEIDYVELSKLAYDQKFVKEPGTPSESELSTELTVNEHTEPITNPVPGEFKLVALTVFEQTPKNYRKVVKPGRCYQFSQAYDLTLDDYIAYDPGRDVRLYNVGDLSVSVAAIVGKNGSGKSTVIELIYLALNNLACEHGDVDADLQFVPGIFLELCYAAENFYRIKLHGSEITISRYEPLRGGYGNPQLLSVKAFNLNELFYTVSVNYSHFALNPGHIGEWINDLFHKNDVYQAPIVINPHRKDGNIDVNIEEAFGNSRLLANLLTSDSENGDGGSGMFRQLTDDRKAMDISLEIHPDKMQFVYVVNAPTAKEPGRKLYGHWEKAKPYWLTFVRTLEEVFEIPAQAITTEPLLSMSWSDLSYRYALKKAINISLRYTKYFGQYRLKKNSFKSLKSYLEALRDDPSHITYKFKQAINFIKYDHIRQHLPEYAQFKKRPIPIVTLAESIDTVLQKAQDEKLAVIHLIPPSFFKSEIVLDDQVTLSSLSSGEKQRIFAVSTISYHLLNINSKMAQDDGVAYRFVNVIFDEIELYFHPDMQRTFIDHLLRYIGYLPLDQLRGLNLIFITHSPFILSDIPADNIMFLGGERSGWNTFGANIHDMLADSFFLKDGVMGEYVKRTILSLSAFLTGKPITGNFQWTRESALNVIKTIGEPIIQKRMEALYFENYRNADRKAEIERLRLILNRLENEENL